MNWFGVVRWCDADIVSALKEDGFAVTDDNVSRVRRQLEHHSFTDVLIERGWDHIHTVIDQMNLEEASDCDVDGDSLPDEAI